MRGSVRRLEPSKSYMRYSGKARSVVSRCIVSLNRRKLLIPLILVAALLVSMSAIHPTHAQIADTISSPHNDIPAPVTLGTPVTYNLTADMIGSSATSGINGWDIIITDNDPSHAFLTPASVSITGNLLARFGGVTELINCVDGGTAFPAGQPGNIGCTVNDGAGIIHTAAVFNGPPSPTPISGLIASLTYTTVSAGPTTINTVTGFDTLSDGTSTPVAHKSLTATYGNTLADFAVTTSNPAPFNPNGTSTDTVRVTAENAYSNTVTFTTDVYPATGLTISCPALSPEPVTTISTASCTFRSNTPGVYNVNVNATDGVIFHIASMVVKVGDFSVTPVSATPAFPKGNTGTDVVNIASVNLFAGTVGVRTTSPAALTTTCTASEVIPAGGTVAETCTFSSSTPGNYPVTINVFYNFTGGSIVHSASITVGVSDFTIAGPTTQPVNAQAGYVGSITVTLTPQFGWNKLVSITATVNDTRLAFTVPATPCGAAFTLVATTNKVCAFTSSHAG